MDICTMLTLNVSDIFVNLQKVWKEIDILTVCMPWFKSYKGAELFGKQACKSIVLSLLAVETAQDVEVCTTWTTCIAPNLYFVKRGKCHKNAVTYG